MSQAATISECSNAGLVPLISSLNSNNKNIIFHFAAEMETKQQQQPIKNWECISLEWSGKKSIFSHW